MKVIIVLMALTSVCAAATITVPAAYPTIQEAETRFQRGGASSDTTLDIADAVFTLSYLFAAGLTPSCLGAVDANDDGTLDIADAIAVLSHLFGSGGDLPAPFGECGGDATTDDLDCMEYAGCS